MAKDTSDPVEDRKLRGHQHFVRSNPKSDKFGVQRFHHLEFYTLDATSTAKRFQAGLGMTWVAKSDISTGNSTCVSHVLKTNDIVFTLTAPQAPFIVEAGSECPLPGYDGNQAYEFLKQHGLAVRAIGIRVDDAHAAYEQSTANGAISVLPPKELRDKASGNTLSICEVAAYGDVVLRFVSDSFQGPFLPDYTPLEEPEHCFGLQRIDHCVGNVPSLFKATDYLKSITGFHEFAEFTAEDVGTSESGLNSLVLANNSEFVLLPVNEPTHGTKRKSQIQTYLEHNGGAGVQHLALKTDDIFVTLRQMRAVSRCGGFDFMEPAPAEYYRRLPDRIGDALTPQQYRDAEELGILVDRDDQGVLLQIFTKQISDRPTFFFEIIQRVGCEHTKTVAAPDGGTQQVVEQAGGCGGFGKGNFSELFKSIERQYEKDLPERQRATPTADAAEAAGAIPRQTQAANGRAA